MFELMPLSRNERKLMNMFDDFDRAFFQDLDKSVLSCRTDVLDKGDRYVLQAELPGFRKEDIHIDIDGDSLTVRAEHSEETKEEKPNFIRRERHSGTYTRSFDVSGVEVENISAKYENGVLELALPKKGEVRPASRSVNID